jgi:hypothetical protein
VHRGTSPTRHVGQRVKGIVQAQHVGTLTIGDGEILGERHFDRVATALVGPASPGRVDQDAPHQSRRHREKMGAVPPVHLLDVDQPHVRLVHQRRGLQGVIRRLAPHAAPGNALQFGMDKRRQPGERRLIPFSPRQQ